MYVCMYVCIYGCFHKWADPAYSNSWMVCNWKIILQMGDFLGTIISGNLYMYIHIANQPDTLQKMTNSLLVNVDIPIDTKRLKD